jgi:hypothetical protein
MEYSAAPRKSKAPHGVEITPAMIEAGVMALKRQVNIEDLLFSAEDIVAEVFFAMTLAAPK